MVLKYLEWNLHAKGGYGYNQIPDFIVRHLEPVDIFVLVEFRQTDNWNEFKSKLKDFDLYCSPYVPKGYNQVCVGVRKSLGYELLSVVSCDVCDMSKPEFLDVGIKPDGKEIRIVGTRIKTGGLREPQVEYLKKYLEDIERFVCLGDYNVVQTTLTNEFSEIGDVYGPRIRNGYYSYVHEEGDQPYCGLDWLISKGIKNVYNGYSNKDDSPRATYDWSFVTESNGYGNKTVEEHLDIDGLPDHAILKGMIET